MEFGFPVTEIMEGAARLLVPDIPRRKGPGAEGPWPFYNPTMTVNRDLGAIVLAKWPHPLGSVLDGLSATGAWGIRMGLEVGVRSLTFNDRAQVAGELIRENLRRNGLAATVRVGDLSSHLGEARYDFVDIDPFGPPTPFLEAALDAAAVPSGMGITATDTAVLCGTYPDACERRYGAHPVRCPQAAEIGLRVLLGYCASLARERGKSIRPLLAFSAEHFLRVYLTVARGSDSAPLGVVVRRGPGEFVPAAAANQRGIGPLWLGPLGEPQVVGRLAPSSWTSIGAARLLSVLQDESGLPPFFVTTDELAALEHGSPPRLDRFLDGLRAIGYDARRTHFHPRGVKTDAPSADVLRVFRESAYRIHG